jgi:transcriptional/translational regulatory protein YebC/TACO1
VLELVEELEDNEDIKKVYTNADIADDVLAAMGD